MHLEGPWLSTTGKRKGKKKFRTSEQAAQARQNDESWAELKKRWGVEQEERKRKQALKAPPLKSTPTYRRSSALDNIPSSNPKDWGVCAKPDPKVYTGDKIKGIGTMHKSNAVPIFSDEQAIEISRMRR